MNTIDGKTLAKKLREHVAIKVAKDCKKKPKLVVFSVNPDPEGISFMAMKERATHELGGSFELIKYKHTPSFIDFANNVKRISELSTTTGIVIQKPLPFELNSPTLFNYVPLVKEIEGHKDKSPFCPPLALAALTVLKYLFSPEDSSVENLIVDIKKDQPLFKQFLKRKKVVIAGRGETGGKPIGHTLQGMGIPFIQTNSKTHDPDQYYKEADIIITCVGRKILTSKNIKPGVILINIGLRRENERWRGDYDEEEIENIASFYTPTPGGTGPFDIAYLMYNLYLATKMQQ